MRILAVAIAIILVVLVVTGFFIFTGNDNYQTQDTGTQSQSNSQSNSGQNTDKEAINNSSTDIADEPQTHTVDIKGYAYSPVTLNVKAGDTVIWTNKDNVRHTVTSDSGSELDSEYLFTGETYSHTFTQPGTYKYHCAPHPNMKATIVVE